MTIKSLFVSDVHLGSPHSQTQRFLEFLSSIDRPEKLYLIGDIVDSWKVRSWNEQCNEVVRTILAMAQSGTEVFYTAGNHDAVIRKLAHGFDFLQFDTLHIGDNFVHTTVDGKRLLVLHGDMFDLVSRHAKWLCKVGDIGYELLMTANTGLNGIRKKFGRETHFSISKSIKRRVKHVCAFISHYEEYLCRYALSEGCDGCVCGHIHEPVIRTLDNGFLYCNSGDWMESCSAIIEDSQGRLMLHQ